MADAIDTQGTVHKDGTKTLMKRAVGADGSPITQATISTVVYSIYLLDDQDPDSRTAVTGHVAVSLTVSDVIFDTLQDDDLWDKDDTGYNFRHTPDLTLGNIFAVAGRLYLIEYTLTPTSGQVIILRFRLNVI
jgi:hypothetical protein